MLLKYINYYINFKLDLDIGFGIKFVVFVVEGGVLIVFR